MHQHVQEAQKLTISVPRTLPEVISRIHTAMFRNIARTARTTTSSHYARQGRSFGYVAPTITGIDEAQIEKVAKMNNYLRFRHVQIEGAMDPVEKDVARRKRMIYRSKQRGWLEADIILGAWAAKYVPGLTEPQLDEYEVILNEETIDVFNFITGT
ncbi:Flavinator of succinate dehydrogenase-domain-containing protein [Ochromonadaceae sp. CCMP2298]|nr:Flavinator of succinate dehydrogenase-domain-containing protein [Ochromonadaceae sp. CCMP2298]